MMKLISIILFYTFFLSCDTSNNINPNIELRFGEIYNNLDYNFSLQIDSVTSDSRCPEGAVCVWAGNAQVRFKMIYNENQQYLFDLNSYITPLDTLIEDLNIKLIKVSPYPKIGEVIEQKDYKVELLIENK